MYSEQTEQNQHDMINFEMSLLVLLLFSLLFQDTDEQHLLLTQNVSNTSYSN